MTIETNNTNNKTNIYIYNKLFDIKFDKYKAFNVYDVVYK